MVKKKYKKLTQQQKKDRKDVKKKLQERGVIPPDKPRLNRKKFANEVINDWNNNQFHISPYVLNLAISAFANTGKVANITSEELGVLKMMKCAMLLTDTLNAASEEGKDITYGEIYEVIEAIIKL